MEGDGMTDGYGLDDPADGARRIECRGHAARGAAMGAHVAASAVATVAGLTVRTVRTRWGVLHAVGGSAFATFREAEAFAGGEASATRAADGRAIAREETGGRE